jgi:preprotein translocase subunit SecF
MILVVMFSFLFIIYKSKRLTEFEKKSQEELANFQKTQTAQLTKFHKDNKDKLTKLKTEQNTKAKDATTETTKKQKDFVANQKKQLQNFLNGIARNKEEINKDIANGREIGWMQATAFWAIFLIFYLIIINGFEVNWNFGQTYSLTVKTKPTNTDVKIMNIKPRYKAGIRLKPGQYVIKAQHPNYKNKYQCVIIKDKNVNLKMKLRKK